MTADNLCSTGNNCTIFSHPILDGAPFRGRLFFTPVWNPPGAPGVYYDDPLEAVQFVGNVYAIRGIDPMPLGAAFNVLVITEATGTPIETPCLHDHFAVASNITGNYTTVNNAGFNGNPGAILLVIRWSQGVDGPRPTGVQYAGDHWRIVNLDLAPMQENSLFELLDIACATDRWRGFIHTATAANITFNSTRISDPALDDQEPVHLQVTQNVNAGGSPPVLNPHAVGVFFNDFVPPPHLWAIFNEDLILMPAGADFNVAEIKVLFASGFERGSTADFDATVP